MSYCELHRKCLQAIFQKDYMSALCSVEEVLSQDVNNIVFLNLKGIILAGTKKYRESITFFSQALAQDPDYFDCLFNRGMSYFSIEEKVLALTDFNTALRLRPSSLKVLLAKGNLFVSLGKFIDARISYEEALKHAQDHLGPEFVDLSINLAVVLQRLGEPLESLRRFSTVLTFDPRNKRGLLNRANLLIELGQYQQAEDDLRLVISDHPEYAEAQNSIGTVFYKRRQFSLAVHHYESAIGINPDFPAALTNLGIAYRELGLYGRAMQLFNRAISIDPNLWVTRWNKGILHLLLGEFSVGWQLYEARKPLNGVVSSSIQAKAFLPGGLGRKSVLIRSEQGYGDTIQFCRLLKVFDLGRIKIYFQVPVSLVDLIATLDSRICVFSAGSQVPSVDLEENLLSLPFFFGLTKEKIPRGAYLKADKQLVLRRKAEINAESNLFKVGIVWSGSKGHDDDAKRSISFSLLSGLFQLPVQWHSLQKEYRDKDRELFLLDARCVDHSCELINFSETAALIECMDLIITVDTAVAHLAGALGKRVWILLPYVPDFRWMLGRNDSPWYQSAELIRQTKIDDWTEVIDRVKHKLARAIED